MIPEEESEETGEVSLHKLRLLEALEEEPQVRQKDLAVRLGVAIGTVNWHLKRLAARDCIKVKKIGKWRWSYILTPKGMAEKARLTRAYIEQSMRLYRETRERAQRLLREVKRAGYDRVRIAGEPGNDLVDVCRLTCLEQGIKVKVEVTTSAGNNGELPVLHIDGQDLSLEWPRSRSHE